VEERGEWVNKDKEKQKNRIGNKTRRESKMMEKIANLRV
jgi:hypothetical protein